MNEDLEEKWKKLGTWAEGCDKGIKTIVGGGILTRERERWDWWEGEEEREGVGGWEGE